MAKAKFKRPLFKKLWFKQRGKCCWCERDMIHPVAIDGIPHPERATIEHLTRKRDGGGDNPDNLALAHQFCNSNRQGMDWLTYKSVVLGEIAQPAR